MNNNVNELQLFHHILLYVVIACHIPFFISFFPQIYNSNLYFTILFTLVTSFVYLIKNLWTSYRSNKITSKFVNLISNYLEKKKKDNFNFFKNEVINNVIDKITENLVYNNLESLNLLEHKESMKKILENINQNRIFEEFFQEVDLIIIDYKLIEKDLLIQILDYSRVKKKMIYLISQDYPSDILKQINRNFFTINNIITPYQFKKNWFGNYYFSDDIDRDYKLDLDTNYLTKHIIDNPLSENKDILFISDIHIENDTVLQICLNNNQKLTNDYFISLINDWIEVN